MKHSKLKARNVLYKYIRDKFIIALVFVLFSIVFAIIFSLYRLETEAVLYASILCFALALIIFVFFFYRYYKKHIALLEIKNNANIMCELETSGLNVIETDYRMIINELIKLKNADFTEWQSQRSENIDFYAAWVHQIKTPISVMKMILQSGNDEDNNNLLAELFRIEQYAEMVLCCYRLDGRSSDFVFKKYSLDGIIKKCIRKYAAQFIFKKIKLAYKSTDKLVLTDEKWLCFIIEQLLSNAVKYTEKGTVSVSVDDNEVFCISDTGIGIAKEDLPRIFDKGFTGYNGRTGSQSTGIGLYLAKTAADKISHRMWAESEKGEGARFFINLNSIKVETE